MKRVYEDIIREMYQFKVTAMSGQPVHGSIQNALANAYGANPISAPTKNLKDLPRESATEAIIGVRAWCVRDGELFSTHQACVWQPQRAMQGTPLYGQGVYAFRADLASPAPCNLSDASTDYTGVRLIIHEHIVTGLVSLWGTVLECEYGYRAQYAYPNALYLCQCGRFNTTIRAVARKYGCDLLPYPA